ncbi:2-amino-4-hydroxy-6-hydroxymethyldihydropteridine diphosphokinase [Allocatelliglobosispora scoriae]|uniref:2-amino-4-hydroxy-6-hydroxymethyldihydropteridine diphosphokinase n=1 Tax=Allocatelliglobosispora scoriae TaxID=643052 RepID=A0A841BU97_9ACTN|nr:2-amino-4-hydroxy-6-hydroxymethyldihydropteridine diphosphokinase [Allocatelliglobosispora scoriae]MBB5871265.1 2-amino-4-hydroxy-6-hydroxymethyldihydropteridine diphosphokinase [Allocatelliglobosispora scoriae]
MTRVLLAFGSNLGDRAAHLRAAVDQLADELVVVSGVYETPPWGDADQPSYLNAVALVTHPTRTVEEWLAEAQRIEASRGRVRDEARRFGPRTLDVDLIAAWTDDGAPVVRDSPELTLPHPRAHLRAFVLRPWLEIQPYASLPGHGWVNDLVLAEPVASDVMSMTARRDVTLD